MKLMFNILFYLIIFFDIFLIINQSLLYIKKENNNYENFILEYTGLKNKDDTFLKKNEKLMNFELGLIIILCFGFLLSFVFNCVKMKDCKEKNICYLYLYN